MKAIERGHKIEELQKRLNESEALRIRYLEKLTALKDQVNMKILNNKEVLKNCSMVFFFFFVVEDNFGKLRTR